MNPETENLTLKDIALYADKCRGVTIFDLVWNKGDMVKCHDDNDSRVSKRIILQALQDNNTPLGTSLGENNFQYTIKRAVFNYLKKQLEIT